MGTGLNISNLYICIKLGFWHEIQVSLVKICHADKLLAKFEADNLTIIY